MVQIASRSELCVTREGSGLAFCEYLTMHQASSASTNKAMNVTIHSV